jgi:hypothetical protein
MRRVFSCRLRSGKPLLPGADHGRRCANHSLAHWRTDNRSNKATIGSDAKGRNHTTARTKGPHGKQS